MCDARTRPSWYSMSDGRLLKPTRPAMSIDSSFLQMAFGSGGPDGELWAAFSEVCVCVCVRACVCVCASRIHIMC